MAASNSTGGPRDVASHILDTAQRIIATRGFAAVGLNEILAAARVPKGSFYHYFASKEVFGREMLTHYFAKYLAEMDAIIGDRAAPAMPRLEAYWRFWRDNQLNGDPDGRCLAVKLGAEVSDVSEEMRLALRDGTSAIVHRLAGVIRDGLVDRSMRSSRAPEALAETLYQLWFGASIMARIALNADPFDTALAATRELLSAG